MQNIIKNIFYTTSRQVLTSLISFALIVAIARFYGPKGNGLFAILLLLPSTLINILKKYIPDNYNHYHEIFTATGSLCFNICSENSSFYEINSVITNFY